MRSFLKWTAAVVGVSVGSVIAWRLLEEGRHRVRTAIGRAEAVADRTRGALEETQGALHDLEASI